MAWSNNLNTQPLDKNYYKNPFTQAGREVLEPPNFSKHAGNPIFTRNNAQWLVDGSMKIYFPFVINARNILGVSALDTFYMYYSSDHSSGEGGIGLATASDPLGPWTDRGKVYSDITKGNQTETPSVIWNEKTSLFHMYYHNNYWQAGDTDVYRTQATCVATSPDGLTWTRYANNPILKIPDVEFPGDGHTGYARVFRIAGTWIATHLMGGTNNAHFGISYSKDGFNWQTDPRPIVGFADLTEDSSARRLEYSGTYPFIYRGKLWACYVTSPSVSGGTSTGKSIYVAPLTDIRKPNPLYKVLDPVASTWENTFVQWPCVLEYNNKLYLFYQGDGSDGNGAIGVAVAEVEL